MNLLDWYLAPSGIQEVDTVFGHAECRLLLLLLLLLR